VDEAPLEECESGDAKWASLAPNVPVNASGIALVEFCCPLITPTIGFRYKYLGQGSGIANWTIIPQNFYWVE
jgi:hypothetical protein